MNGNLAHFFLRWSSTDITLDNAMLFEEHLSGVKTTLTKQELKALAGITRTTPRAEFAKRYQNLRKN